jgi:hypothetical protein
MTHPNLTPGNVVADAVQNHHDKFLAMIVWKYAKSHGGRLELTEGDMADYIAAFPGGDSILLTHGHDTWIEFQVTTFEIAEHRAAKAGTIVNPLPPKTHDGKVVGP